MTTYFKKALKYPIIVISILAVIYFGTEAGYQARYKLELWKEYKSAEKFNQAIIDMFKNDTYGGKTPEETFNMFVGAIKNEDVDLAVKYFVLDLDRRENYRKKFNDLKTQGKLKEYGEDWPKWKEFKQIKDEDNDWENQAAIEHTYYRSQPQTVNLPNGAGGYIEHTFQPGYYVDYAPVFTKNTNGIWKIENL